MALVRVPFYFINLWLITDHHRYCTYLYYWEADAVQVDLKERTVAFAVSFATVRSLPRYSLGGRGYYEMEILERDRIYPQYGFAATALARVLGVSDEEVGVGLFAAFLDKPGKVHFNLGEADFRPYLRARPFSVPASYSRWRGIQN